jgi:hypothetical protein
VIILVVELGPPKDEVDLSDLFCNSLDRPSKANYAKYFVRGQVVAIDILDYTFMTIDELLSVSTVNSFILPMVA